MSRSSPGTPGGPRAAVVLALLLVAALLVPASPAVAARNADPTEAAPIALDQRAVARYTGVWPAPAAGFVLPTDARELLVSLPELVSPNIVSLDRDATVITWTVGSTTITGGLLNVDAIAVLVAIPAGLRLPELRWHTVVRLHISSLMRTGPFPRAADDDHIDELELDIGLEVGPRGFTDRWDVILEASSVHDIDYDLIDSSRVPVPIVHWGDRLRITSTTPGYFESATPLTAAIWPWPLDELRVPVTPVVSADGRIVTIDLPAAPPDVGLGLSDWPSAGLAISALADPAGGRRIPIVDLAITRMLRVAGTTPHLTAPRVLRTVTALPGAWGPWPVRLSYQWLIDGVPIAGATRATFTPRLRDLNRQLSVRVTGTKAGYEPTVLTSAPQRVRVL